MPAVSLYRARLVRRRTAGSGRRAVAGQAFQHPTSGRGRLTKGRPAVWCRPTSPHGGRPERGSNPEHQKVLICSDLKAAEGARTLDLLHGNCAADRRSPTDTGNPVFPQAFHGPAIGFEW
jgi:hypothetical protein